MSKTEDKYRDVSYNDSGSDKELKGSFVPPKHRCCNRNCEKCTSGSHGCCPPCFSSSKGSCVCTDNPKDRLKGLPLAIVTLAFVLIVGVNYALRLSVYKKTLLFAPLVSQLVQPLMIASFCLPSCLILTFYNKCRKCDLKETRNRGLSNYSTTPWYALLWIFGVLSFLQYYSDFVFSRYSAFVPEYLRTASVWFGIVPAVCAGMYRKRRAQRKGSWIRSAGKSNNALALTTAFYCCLALCCMMIDVTFKMKRVFPNSTGHQLETEYPCFPPYGDVGSERHHYSASNDTLPPSFPSAPSLHGAWSEVVVIDGVLPLTIEKLESGNGSYATFVVLFTSMLMLSSLGKCFVHDFGKAQLDRYEDLTPFNLTLWTGTFQCVWMILTVPFFHIRQTFSYGSNYPKEGLACILAASLYSVSREETFSDLPMIDSDHRLSTATIYDAQMREKFVPCDDWRSRVNCESLLYYSLALSVLTFVENWLTFKILKAVDLEYSWFCLVTAFTLKNVLYSLDSVSGIYSVEFGIHQFYLIIQLALISWSYYYNVKDHVKNHSHLGSRKVPEDRNEGKIYVVSDNDHEYRDDNDGDNMIELGSV